MKRRCYHETVQSKVDPVDARNVAVQRLVDETGVGLNEHEIMEVTKAEG